MTFPVDGKIGACPDEPDCHGAVTVDAGDRANCPAGGTICEGPEPDPGGAESPAPAADGHAGVTIAGLALNAPILSPRQPREEAAVLAALEGLYRDFLQARLDSKAGWSVDHDPPTEEPV
jgi:hypothetical protein